jgi:hypothetical protein
MRFPRRCSIAEPVAFDCLADTRTQSSGDACVPRSGRVVGAPYELRVARAKQESGRTRRRLLRRATDGLHFLFSGRSGSQGSRAGRHSWLLHRQMHPVGVSAWPVSPGLSGIEDSEQSERRVPAPLLHSRRIPGFTIAEEAISGPATRSDPQQKQHRQQQRRGQRQAYQLAPPGTRNDDRTHHVAGQHKAGDSRGQTGNQQDATYDLDYPDRVDKRIWRWQAVRAKRRNLGGVAGELARAERHEHHAGGNPDDQGGRCPEPRGGPASSIGSPMFDRVSVIGSRVGGGS